MYSIALPVTSLHRSTFLSILSYVISPHIIHKGLYNHEANQHYRCSWGSRCPGSQNVLAPLTTKSKRINKDMLYANGLLLQKAKRIRQGKSKNGCTSASSAEQEGETSASSIFLHLLGSKPPRDHEAAWEGVPTICWSFGIGSRPLSPCMHLLLSPRLLSKSVLLFLLLSKQALGWHRKERTEGGKSYGRGNLWRGRVHIQQLCWIQPPFPRLCAPNSGHCIPLRLLPAK